MGEEIIYKIKRRVKYLYLISDQLKKRKCLSTQSIFSRLIKWASNISKDGGTIII